MSSNHLLEKNIFTTLCFSLINENKWDTLLEFFALKIIDINIKDHSGRNSLFWAIQKNQIDVIKKLVSLNINTNEVSPNLSAINYAVHQDNVKAIRCLKNCGINVNEIDDINSTALIYAIICNKSNCINYLLNNGANIYHEDFLGNSAFSLAQDLKLVNLVKMLKEFDKKSTKKLNIK